MSPERIKYVIFKTKWGWFGLAGTAKRLAISVLPLPDRKAVNKIILKSFPAATEDKNLYKAVQRKVTAYFEGRKSDFTSRAKDGTSRQGGFSLNLDSFSEFERLVLSRCRLIGFGRVITYAKLAAIAGRPLAARAVGNALAKNKLPLIIPCHRIIRSNGEVGRFSSPGGSMLKQKLLNHEKAFFLSATGGFITSFMIKD